MKNLVLKSTTKSKKFIYKKITWIDLLITLIYLAISICIPIGFLFLHIGFRFLISLFIFIILMLSMIFLKEQNCRIYEFIYRYLRYKINPKIYDKNSLRNSYQLVPYQSIDENNLITIQYENNKLFKTKNKVLYSKIFKITGVDLSILSVSERENTINQFKEFLVKTENNFSLYKIDESISIESKLKYIQEKINFVFNLYNDGYIEENEYETKIKLLSSYKEELKKLDKNFIKEKNIYIVLYSEEVSELYSSINVLENCFKSGNLEIKELNEKEIINFHTKSFNPYQKNESEDFLDESQKLSERIAFGKIQFNKNHFVINNKLFGSFFSIKDYPIALDDFWIAELLFNNDANISINFSNCDFKKSKKTINYSLVNASNNSKYLKDFSENERFDELKKISDDFLLKKEVIKNVNVTFYTYSNSYVNLMDKNSELENILFKNQIKIHKMSFLQVEGLLTYSSFGFNELNKKFGYDFPTSTISNGFPFLLNNLNDNSGLKLGIDSFKQEVWLDIFSKKSERKNNNVIIYGQKGSGKSTLISKLVTWNYAQNKNIFIIDTNNQYKNFCSYFNGEYIDISNLEKSINPLQIFNLNEDKQTNTNLINNHLLMLESFFKLILKNLTETQIEILIYAIDDVYKKFDLKNKDLKSLKANEFPIITDVYEHIIENKEKLIEKYDLSNIQKIINSLEKNFLKGCRYYELCNNYTSLNFNNSFVVFNLMSIVANEQNKTIVQAQIYLIINLLQLNLSSDYDNIVVIDELYSIIENNDSLIVNCLNNFSKIISKNNGSLIVSIRTWDENNKNSFSALFNESQYAFYFAQNPQTIKLLNNLYDHNSFKMSELEESFLLSARSGQCLLFISNLRRYQLSINLFKFEKEIINYVQKEDE